MEAERITPTKAKEYLLLRGANRVLSDGKVLEYAIAMEQGQWSLNGETIKFDDEGKLFDGQHRLEACVLAKVPFETYVARGISDERAMATVDTGKARSHTDVWSIAGHKNAAAISTIALMFYMVEHGRVSWSGYGGRRIPRNSPVAAGLKKVPQFAGNVRKDELLAWAEPFMPELDRAACAVYTHKQRIAGPQAAGALYLYAHRKDPGEALSFLKDLSQGVGLNKGDPVLTAREHLIARSVGARLPRTYVLGVLIKAWNARRDGRQIKVLRVVDGEPFPKVK